MNYKTHLLILLLGASAASLHGQTEIGFIEKFALTPDREKALGELVPGTEDYYFFHALHYQNSGQKDKLKAILQQWETRHPGSTRIRLIENRDAILRYESDPRYTLEYLTDHLDLEFEDVQETRDEVPDVPDRLDETQIARSVFMTQALTADNLSGFKQAGLHHLLQSKISLSPAQRRSLLSLVTRPDIPGLLPLVIEDLKSEESRGFGEFPIHAALLPDQLNELGKQIRSLVENEAYVNACLAKLAPNADKDLEIDREARLAWLDRLWNYAKALPPSFNSLKASILYQRLDLDRRMGLYDKGRFTEYLKLPRSANYVNPDWIQNRVNSRALVNRGVSFNLPTFQPIGEDEPLVRDYLIHLLKDEPAWEPWAQWLRESWLKAIFAESKILNGAGSPDQWASLLSPTEFQALRDRIDVDLAPDNVPVSVPGDDVALKVRVKNSPKVIVKIYEINTLNYFLANKRQLNTDLALDGLVANFEEVRDLSSNSPFIKTTETFDFPALKNKRGAWVIEFIGGGKSSRALIRKGQWSLLQEVSAGGDLLTIMDEAKAPVRNAVAWFEGRKFPADAETGKILIPFSPSAGAKPIVLAEAGGEFASLASFQHNSENYTLDARFYIEREQLLAGKEATLAIRTDLLCNGQQLPVQLMTDTNLTLTVDTLDDISTTMEVPSPVLENQQVFTHRFKVPDRTLMVTATLTGKIGALTEGGEKRDLNASKTFSINGMDQTVATYDTQLSKFGNDYVFELLGKNGEPIPNQQIDFSFLHSDFTHSETVYLRTNEKGRTNLGPLTDIEIVTANAPNERIGKWEIKNVAHTPNPDVHAEAGEEINIPWSGGGSFRSLLEMRGGTPVREIKEGISTIPGFLVIKNLAPGDYSLVTDGPEPLDTTIRVTAGKAVEGWLVSSSRELEENGPKPVQLTSVAVEGDQLVIRVANANPFTRVHVAATRFVPIAEDNESIGLFKGLGSFTRNTPRTAIPGSFPNLFSDVRQIGDEYRYILDRRYAKRLPGNMLVRPSLLLNPWEVGLANRQEQITGTQGEGAGAGRGGRVAQAAQPSPSVTMDHSPPAPEDGTSIDYLADAAPVLYNLLPDEAGVVRIPRTTFKDRQHIQIYAEDQYTAAWTTLALAEVPTKFRDLRLLKNLDPSKPYLERKEVTLLDTGKSLKLEDRSTSEIEIYGTLEELYELFATINPTENFAKFDWILKWPSLSEEERAIKYSEFACHELNFFLAQKDKTYFDKVVRPYLKNKKDKTFMDRYLLGDDLHPFLQPWAYGQLNLAEKCLLARRIGNAEASAARYMRERWELEKPDPERDDTLFETALHRGLLAESAAVPVTTTTSYYSAPATSEVLADGVAEEDSDNKKNGRQRAQTEELRTSLDHPGQKAAAAAQRLREIVRPFYRNVGPTKVWAENNYYKLKLTEQGSDLIKINKFWRDYAAWDGKQPFLSQNIADATGNFTEMMLALALIDLPFKGQAPKEETAGTSVSVTASSPLIAYHKEITPAPISKEAGALLVSQNFLQENDRKREQGNEEVDRYISDEFLVGTVYGANIVVTNPTSASQKSEVLLQIPQGALPVNGSKATASERVILEAYATETIEYYFYFPVTAGTGKKFPHYPVHIAKAGQIVGEAKPFEFNVVNKLTQIDQTSWDYVSQYGSEAEVFAFLDKNNLQRLELNKIAWRCRKSADFYRKLIAFLNREHIYDNDLFRYGVFHKDQPVITQWLQHQDNFLMELGPWISTKLLNIDPIARGTYQHLEYWPLINQRALKFGAERRIANPAILRQYQELLNLLAYKPTLSPMDELSVVYYLFLQDRAAEALDRLKLVKADSIDTQLQLDYIHCYAAFYESKPEEARRIASAHVAHAVNRWKEKFAEVIAQADEIAGTSVKRAGHVPGRETQQEALASTEPSFEFETINQSIGLTWNNLKEIRINYYLLDPEFSFSANPFASQENGQTSIIKPNQSTAQALPEGKTQLEIPIPADLVKSDLLIEIVGAGLRRVQTYHANSMRVMLAENYGILDVREQANGKAIPAAYVKVYARLADGGIRFYKDGYTDLRGKFDYASLNTGMEADEPPVPLSRGAGGLDHPGLSPAEIGSIEKLAILIMSEGNGTEVREVNPPSE